MIYHPDVNGRAESFPLPGRNEVFPAYLKGIIKRFDLPNDFFD